MINSFPTPGRDVVQSFRPVDDQFGVPILSQIAALISPLISRRLITLRI